MKNILLFAVVVLAGLGSFAQDGKVINDPNAVKRSAQGFHAIQISSGIDLYLSQGGEEGVAVSASEARYRDRIQTQVENGVLRIFIDNHGIMDWGNWGNKKLRAYVSCKMLDGLKASGGSDVYINDVLKADKLMIELSGGSDLRGKLAVGDLDVHQGGGSDSYVSGTAGSLSVRTGGGSDFHGYELSVDNCKAEASGGSDIYLFVNKELDASASGGADIHYKGNPSGLHTHTSGGGDIHRKS